MEGLGGVKAWKGARATACLGASWKPTRLGGLAEDGADKASHQERAQEGLLPR